jgi:Orsellinic acid/F9775 biosynthesis cluster protein D
MKISRVFFAHITFISMDTSFDRTITYIPECHVLLCLLCCIGVRRSQLISHFRTQHRFTSVQSKALDSFCHSILPDLDVQPIETVPSYVENPIPRLSIFSDAFLCQLDRTECQYVCRSTEKMRKHCRKIHQWQQQSHKGRPSTAVRATLPPLPWISVRCQRLFASGPGSHYFAVRTMDQTVETPVSRTWQQMETAVQQAQEALLDNIQDNSDDISPWLRRTRWAEILQGFTRTQLLCYIQEPDVSEESDETKLWNAVRRLIEHCQRTVMKSGNFVRMQMVQTEQTSRPQQPLQAYFHHTDLLKSCRLWQQIILFFVRSHSESSNLLYELTTIQQRSLQRLKDCLHTESREESTSPIREEDDVSTLEQTCLDFCFSLLNHSLRTDEYESALIVALAVLGLTEHGFRGPHDYPSMLSGLIKTSRFMMVQLAVRPSKATEDFFYDLGTETQPDQYMISRVEQIVRQFMIRGSQSPMQWMLDLRSYGMKIAFNTTVNREMD